MATPEALIKYYECLKDSFNKIQVKDNKIALINAALRPKIRDEFVKNKGILVSYLNYIQVFTPIYSDKFNNICFSVICPLFKENSITFASPATISNEDSGKADDVATLLHNTVREILKTVPELAEDYIHCVIKFYHFDNYDTFINYTANCLEICSYIRGEPLTTLMAKILDRANPATSKEQVDEEKLTMTRNCTTYAYEIIYKRLETLEKRQLNNVSAAILAAFTREFLTSENGDSLNYLILYVCSQDEKLTDLFINLLWATFTNPNRTREERKASACFASSFMSRAVYVDINKVLNYLETAVIWCNDFLFKSKSESIEASNVINENTEIFNSLVYSILYLITQRYRELYEKESIERLQKMDLDKILSSSSKPLDICDDSIEQRFREVATLYSISDLKLIDKPKSAIKRLKSDQDLNHRASLQVPFKETNLAVPEHVRKYYRNYYDHRNFTVYRE